MWWASTSRKEAELLGVRVAVVVVAVAKVQSGTERR